MYTGEQLAGDPSVEPRSPAPTVALYMRVCTIFYLLEIRVTLSTRAGMESWGCWRARAGVACGRLPNWIGRRATRYNTSTTLTCRIRSLLCE